MVSVCVMKGEGQEDEKEHWHDTVKLGRIVARGAQALQRGNDTHATTTTTTTSSSSSSSTTTTLYDYLVVLNYKLPTHVPLLWEKCGIRICADGGANRVFDEMPSKLSTLQSLDSGCGLDSDSTFRDASAAEQVTYIRELFIPNAIIGDMDSIRDGVKEYYIAQGSEVIDLRHDQDSTDLKKCVRHIASSMDAKVDVGDGEDKAVKTLVIGALGGRLDHELANLSILYEYHRFCNNTSIDLVKQEYRRMGIVIVSDECIAFVLPSGKNHIHLVRESMRLNEHSVTMNVDYSN